MSRPSEPSVALTMRRVHAGGHAVDVRGTFAPQRPPIVLVHGIGMSAEYFLPFAEVMAATHDVYAVDLPGYGGTPNPARALTVAELGGIVTEIVVALGLDAPVLIGHSMGCQIVAHAVADHPELSAGYVLVGPTVDPRARSLPRQGLRLLKDSTSEPLSSNTVIFRNYLRMGPLRYLRTARYMLADHTEDTIRRCPIPGLVIRGELDPIASAPWVRELVRLAPNAALLEVPGGPHALQHNQPEQLAAACMPFLTSLARRRPDASTEARNT
ncbi:alpha/beta fold hydrolase [Nesterenkonia lutea]|uniref:Pimeloyl-ACP methyl ester carboxylesterase n=1 Tax=Nesterenkonia lutea TaxID=272919 RepID=A0ABR9JHH2_9MICC|nr:alpha/beta hydrolase [Nesterenkonia lutea]MBE1525376.1 pimeloyl-ACP methyl ester carboxylesterase [Nesterenkonia lutea]